MSEIKQILPNIEVPLRVGITGGIGSGKTTICRIFEELGIPVYYADERAKALMVEDKIVVGKVKELFGAEAYFSDGTLNRKLIAGVVFGNEVMLEKLNAIVHPAVLKDGDKWHESQQAMPYTLKESAILFEIGSELFYDKTILVFAPKEIRIQRAMERDGVTREAVEARMARQTDDKEKLQLADYVINNDSKSMLLPQVMEVHRQLLELAQGSNSPSI